MRKIGAIAGKRLALLVRAPLALGALAAAVVGCGGASLEIEPDRGDKIPITTRSAAARDLFVEGRGLAEQAQFAEARALFRQAVETDSGFALAHMMLAGTARSPSEFFDNLGRAVELAASVSEGEQLLIFALDAGSRGDLTTQRQHLDRLIELYPRDERAHFNLGAYHFGRQEYDRAIEEYRAATEIAPDYSPAYNLLGYAYRASGRFAQAEGAFRRYIELVPDEPNPYDSYAEFLMKGGRFEESIANYEKALDIDPRFVPSFIGIAHNQVLLGRGGAARATLERLFDAARNDGERRQALFWTAVTHIHDGDHALAEAKLGEMLAIARASRDWAQVAGDLTLIGDLRQESTDTAGARAAYDQALTAIEKAEVNEDVKDRFRRGRLYRQARLAIEEADLAAAERLIDAFADAVARRNIPREVRLLHELQGLSALAAGDPAAAVSHLERADQQDPRVLYELATAHRRAGEVERARARARAAAEWNQLDLNYAYVRGRAARLLAEL